MPENFAIPHTQGLMDDNLLIRDALIFFTSVCRLRAPLSVYGDVPLANDAVEGFH
jgi:hypothetical protein